MTQNQFLNDYKCCIAFWEQMKTIFFRKQFLFMYTATFRAIKKVTNMNKLSSLVNAFHF
jgi:hypothetical protein